MGSLAAGLVKLFNRSVRARGKTSAARLSRRGFCSDRLVSWEVSLTSLMRARSVQNMQLLRAPLE